MRITSTIKSLLRILFSPIASQAIKSVLYTLFLFFSIHQLQNEKQEAALIQDTLEKWVAHEVAGTAPPSVTRVEISGKWDELFWSHVQFLLFAGLSCGFTVFTIGSLSRLTGELDRHAHSANSPEEKTHQERAPEEPA